MLYLLDRLIIWLSGKIHSVTLCRVDSKDARLSLYRDRSLVIPVESIAHKQESNLCNTCAIAKSTRTLAYNTQSRSDNFGKMWFFDVSELLQCWGIENTDAFYRPSFIEHTEWNRWVLFLRYDNGKLNSKCVWELIIVIRVFIFIRYIHPYHSNENCFVERSFRRVKDMERRM